MRLAWRRAALLACALVLALEGGNVPPAHSQGAGDAGQDPGKRVAGVVLTQDTLSVNVQNEDFTAIFRAIASEARIETSNLEGLTGQRISIQFADLAITEGVKRLLRAADVPGYVLVTDHTDDRVRIERILFLDANANTAPVPRSASPPRMARRRARRLSARTERARSDARAGRPQETSDTPTDVIEDLRASPETERLLNQAVHPDEQMREQAIEGLVRLAGGSSRKRDLLEVLGPQLDDLRHGDAEAREEAREDILSMMRR